MRTGGAGWKTEEVREVRTSRIVYAAPVPSEFALEMMPLACASNEEPVTPHIDWRLTHGDAHSVALPAFQMASNAQALIRWEQQNPSVNTLADELAVMPEAGGPGIAHVGSVAWQTVCRIQSGRSTYSAELFHEPNDLGKALQLAVLEERFIDAQEMKKQIAEQRLAVAAVPVQLARSNDPAGHSECVESRVPSLNAERQPPQRPLGTLQRTFAHTHRPAYRDLLVPGPPPDRVAHDLVGDVVGLAGLRA